MRTIRASGWSLAAILRCEQKLNRDPVMPARRSSAARDKVHTRLLADGTPAMSFTRLLAHLATIVGNTLRPRSARSGEATFALTTRPDPKQQHALNLIATIAV